MIAPAPWSTVTPAAPPSRPFISIARRLIVVLAAVALTAYTIASIAILNRRVDRQIEVTAHSFVISDLFPRWYGAKAMLAGISPYSEAFRDDLVRQYYGQAVTREWERDTFRNVCEFFYPPYVIVPLLPLLALPFEAVRWLGGAVLAAAIAGGTILWVRFLGARLSAPRSVVVGTLSLAFYPSLDAILLQQPAALVYIYVIAAIVLASGRRYAVAGILLALAMIKPQSALIPAVAFIFWSLWDRSRWPLTAWFASVMAGQLALAQWLVPGWLPDFLAANARYREFNTIGFWLPGELLGGDVPGALVGAAPLVAFLAWGWWHARRDALSSAGTARLIALTLVGGVILMPDISYYNKIFLIPAIASALFTPVATGRGPRLARRFAGLAVWVPAAFFVAVGAALTFGGADGPLATATVVIANASEAHFLMLPVLILPTALTEFMAARR